MPLWTDVVTPAELTGYVRAALGDYEQNRATLGAFLPNNYVSDVVARLMTGGNGLPDTASFRAYDAETPIGKREGGSRKTIDLPPLGKKVRVSEYDQLRARNADGPEEVRNAIEREAVRQARAVADRMEQARGQALTTGKVTIDENGLIAEADFGRAAGHTVTAGTLWSAAGAAPFDDLETWESTYRTDNGESPGAVVMSRRILNVLRGKLVGSGSITGRATTDQVQQAFDDLGLGVIFVYDRLVRVAGTNTRVIADDTLVLVPAPVDPNSPDSTDLGAAVWGRTLESMDASYAIEDAAQPGIVAGAYKDDDPLGVWVKATGIGLPVLANPVLSFAAKVL